MSLNLLEKVYVAHFDEREFLVLIREGKAVHFGVELLDRISKDARRASTRRYSSSYACLKR